MTYRNYVSCAWTRVWSTFLIQATILNQIANITANGSASFLFIDGMINEHVFETRFIYSFEDCVQTCGVTTSCRFVNYRIRGHICTITHYIGEKVVTVTEERRAGYTSWMKSSTNIFQQGNGACPNCQRTQSCAIEATGDACTIVACGKPPPYHFSTKGNMYSVGNKVQYNCLNHVTLERYPHTLVCTEEGRWEDWTDSCGYTRYRMTDGTELQLKAFVVGVNKATAMNRCEQDGASLTTVLSLEKLNILRKLLENHSGTYWVDTERETSGWKTSDGSEQPLDDDLWFEHRAENKYDNCARLRYSRIWKLDDRKCSTLFGYICEI